MTQPQRTPAGSESTRFRSSDKAIDLKKLLEVYDDYPVVLHSLERTTIALQHAEDDIRVAEERKEHADEDLKLEKEEREKERKQAEKDQKDAIKSTDNKVRAELNPKIKALEEKLKAMTTDRDTQKKELGDLRGQMGGWITSMDKLHKERIAGEVKEVKAAEERQKLADKLKTLDDEILVGLKKASEKIVPPAPAPVRSESRQTVRTSADNHSVAPTISRTSSMAPTIRESDRSDSRQTLAPTISRATSRAPAVRRGDGLER